MLKMKFKDMNQTLQVSVYEEDIGFSTRLSNFYASGFRQ